MAPCPGSPLPAWCWDPPVRGEAVQYSTLWCRYPIAMGTPQHATGGQEALSAWRASFWPRLPPARSSPRPGARLQGWVGAWGPGPLPLTHKTEPTSRLPPGNIQETTRCPWVQGGSASFHSCAESQLLIFRAVSPASGSELPEWGRCDPALRADLRGLFPSPEFWSLSVAVKY